MSTEELEQVAEETPEAAEAEAPEQEAEKEAPQADTDGKKFVDFTELPPEVEARFKRMYGHMKQYERVAQEHAKVNKALVERLEKLEEGDFQERMETIQEQQRQAWENGDYDKAQKLNDKLIDYKLAQQGREEKGGPEVTAPNFQEDPIPEEHMGKLSAWASETGRDGQPLRPWANPQHPQHRRALHAIQSAVLDPDLYDVETGEGFENVLKHVDGKMGRASSKPSPGAVLPGSGDTSPRQSARTPRLTPEQIRAAEGMGYTPKQYADLIQKYGVK